jgi:hypothetical protein
MDMNSKHRENAYSLAADLIPPKGIKELQADNFRQFARKVFDDSRPRRIAAQRRFSASGWRAV